MPTPYSRGARASFRLVFARVVLAAPVFREKCRNTVSQRDRIERFTFPNNQDIPAEGFQRVLLGCVTFDVLFELFFPVRRPGLWCRGTTATSVTVPKTSVDENDLSQPRKDQIRRSRQVATMKAKAIPQSAYQPANDHFRLGVLAVYSRHEGGSRRVDDLSSQCPDHHAFGSATSLPYGYAHCSDILTSVLR